MYGKLTMGALITVAAFLSCWDLSCATPAIATGYDSLQICMENCAQCKKMLGSWFEGHLCAGSCFKYKGKIIPECEDLASIAQFLNKL